MLGRVAAGTVCDVFAVGFGISKISAQSPAAPSWYCFPIVGGGIASVIISLFLGLDAFSLSMFNLGVASVRQGPAYFGRGEGFALGLMMVLQSSRIVKVCKIGCSMAYCTYGILIDTGRSD